MAAAKKSSAKTVKVTKPKNGVQYTQSEFYECVQQACELENKRVAKDVYNGMVGMIQAALKKGYRIPLPGLGKIQVRESKARMGRNPATGEAIRIPAKKRVRLTPNKALKEKVL
jgi:DNA-binding protein HU-beta